METKKQIAVTFGEEWFYIDYHLYSSSESCPEYIEIESVKYQGVELVYMINEVPGLHAQFVNAIYEQRETDRKSHDYEMPGYRETIDLMHKICAPRI